MTELTKEQLIEEAKLRIAIVKHYANSEVEGELFKIALESLEQNALSGNSRFIPGEVLSAIMKFARVRADFDDFDGDRRGIGDCLDEAEQELIVTINKYASQLAAEPIATNDARERQTATDNTAQQFEALAGINANKYHGQWVNCIERLPDRFRDVPVMLSDGSQRVGRINHKDTWLIASYHQTKHQYTGDVVMWFDTPNPTSAVDPRVSGWSERQQKVIAYSLWRFSCTAYQKANQAAQANNKDMFDRFIRDARCADEIREEFTSAWGGKP